MTDDEKKQFAERLSEIFNNANDNLDSLQETTETRIDEISTSIEDLPKWVSEYDDEFERLTQLRDKDIRFLMFACILQATRIVVMEHFKKRLSDKESAKQTLGHEDEHTDRTAIRYYASIDEIKKNPVPFDCILKEDVVKRNGNPKLSGFNHRFKTLGHDPYLGFIFGTLNIMTKTITVTNGWGMIQTYHVHTGTRIRRGKVEDIDKICAQASTAIMFEKPYQRFQNEGAEAWKALGESLKKEWVHLHSDIRTAKSLPIPGVSLLSPDVARIMQFCGLDYLNVKIFEKEAFLSMLINWIIGFTHGHCYNEFEDKDLELYKVRTMKIIDISNEMVTLCSALVMAVRAYLGDADAIKKFDFGGAVVTLWHVLNDPITIANIKHEYILRKTSEKIKNL